MNQSPAVKIAVTIIIAYTIHIPLTRYADLHLVTVAIDSLDNIM